MYEKNQEPIDVIAYFSPAGRIQPLRFRWNGQVYKPLKINSSWNVYNNGRKLWYFSITTPSADCFELIFDPANLNWSLARVYVPG